MRVEINKLGTKRNRHLVWMASLAVTLSGIITPAWGQFLGDVAVLNSNAGADSGDDGNVQLATDGAGNWVAVWQSDDTLDGSIGNDLDILVATSSDGGATWSDPAALNSDATTDSIDDLNPAIVSAGANWIVVWQCDMPGGGTVSNVHHSRSADGGSTWSAQTTFSTPSQQNGGTDADPALATDGSRTIAVWSSTRDIDGNQNTTSDADIFMSVSTDGGGSWSTASVLNTNNEGDAAADTTPSIATDGDGNWMAVWHSTLQIVFARSEDNGGTWSPLQPLPGSAGGVGPQIGSDFQRSESDTDAGYWLASWTLGNNVVAARFLDTGPDFSLDVPEGEIEDVWREPVTVGAGTNPYIATDRLGTWMMVWETAAEGGADLDVISSRSVNNGIDWMEALLLEANADGDAGDDTTPRVATDGQSNWVAAWSSDDDRDGIGMDGDLLVVPFTFLPDCNENGVSDVQDLANGLTDPCLTGGPPANDNTNDNGANTNDNTTNDNANDNAANNNANANGNGNDNSGGLDDLIPSGPCGFGMLGTFAVLMLGLGLIQVSTRRRRAR